MGSRNRGYGASGSDWDPMRYEYENSTYESQTPDDDSEGVCLEHCRLYITNIPKGLNLDGLSMAFSKYGTLTEAYLSSDPQKCYGLISYETPGEAKLAMMKLNKSEPLRLNVNIARKPNKKVTQDNSRWSNGTRDRSYRERGIDSEMKDNSSTSSRRGGSRSEMSQGEIMTAMNDLPDEELDDDVKQTLEHLRQLLIKQKQCSKNQDRAPPSSGLGNRCFMPGGKIVVRNDGSHNASEKTREDSSYCGATGDSYPALQHEPRNQCVCCGAEADAFCARCGVTPYCSPRCQRRDWAARHHAVCHNLIGTVDVEVPKTPDRATSAALNVSSVTPVAPLRQPRPRNDDHDDSASRDRGSKKFTPAGYSRNQDNRNADRNYDRNQDRNQDRNRNNDNRGRPQQRDQGYQNRSQGYQNKGQGYQNKGQGYQQRGQAQDEEEDWGATKQKADTPAATIPKPSIPKPEPKPTQPEPKPTQPEPKPAQPEPEDKKPAMKLITNAALTTPVPRAKPKVEEKPLVPEKCVLDLVKVADVLLISVENKTSDCAVPTPGFVCTAFGEEFQTDYMALCEDYAETCQKDTEEFIPEIGCICSLRDADGLWYRALRIAPLRYALLDCGRLCDAAGRDTRRLAKPYSDLPQFGVYVTADNIKIGDSLKCVIDSVAMDGKFKVTLTNAETAEMVASCELARWRPIVENPEPVVVPEPAPVTPPIPVVPRPDLTNESHVFLLHYEGCDMFLIPADENSQREADMIEQDVALYAQNASPLKEPPSKGDVVIAKFTDGNHYRALCKRTSVKQNKYLLEYVEYGNSEVSSLDKLYACPPQYQLDTRPAVTLRAVLHSVSKVDAAKEYLEKLKEAVNLVLTLPDGKKQAPSGSEVILTVESTRENVNKKIEEISKPDWKKIEENGGDILETEILMLSDVIYVDFPTSKASLKIMDSSVLELGSLAVAPTSASDTLAAAEALKVQMDEYCNSKVGQEPYLPRYEELCLAQSSATSSFRRAVLCEQPAGAGSSLATVMFLDSGVLQPVPAKALRKCTRAFLKVPVAVCHAELHGFPKEPTPAQLAAAKKYLQIKDDGSGSEFEATKCEKVSPGEYVIHVPGLIKALEEV